MKPTHNLTISIREKHFHECSAVYAFHCPISKAVKEAVEPYIKQQYRSSLTVGTTKEFIYIRCTDKSTTKGDNLREVKIPVGNNGAIDYVIEWLNEQPNDVYSWYDFIKAASNPLSPVVDCFGEDSKGAGFIILNNEPIVDNVGIFVS